MGLAETIAATAIDANYSVWGKVASYQPPSGGDPVPCIVLLDVRDNNAKPEDGSPPAGQSTIEVRAKEVAQPASEGTFTMDVGGKVFSVMSRPLPADGDGYGWKMWVEE